MQLTPAQPHRLSETYCLDAPRAPRSRSGLTLPTKSRSSLREALSGVAVTHSTINSRSVPCGDHRLQVQGFSDGVECVSGVVTKDFREETGDRVRGGPDRRPDGRSLGAASLLSR